MSNPFSRLLNYFGGGGSTWTMPPVSRGSGAIPQPAPMQPEPSTNPVNAYFTQLADPRYRQAMQQQNLFSNLLNFGAQMSAARAPSLDPGYAARTRAGALAGLGQGLTAGNQAYQNQLIQAIKLKQLMRQNEIAQAKEAREEKMAPIKRKYWEAKSRTTGVPTPAAMQKNYEFAKTQGYKGTFMDYVMSVNAARGGAIYTPPAREATTPGAVPSSVISETVAPDGAVPPSTVGKIQPLPGSAAAIAQAQQQTRETEQELKIEKRKEKAEKRRLSRARAGGTVIQDIGRALDIVQNPGWLSASGIVGGVTAEYPKLSQFLPAAEAKGHIESALSNVGLDTLQSMREGSETGGALGQVPIQQQKRLEQVLGSLDLSQRKEVISDNLKRVHNIYMDIVHGSPEQIQKLVADGKISEERADQLSERYELSFDEFGRPVRIPPVPDGVDKDEWPEIWSRMSPKQQRFFREGS
jgi:hypothetical protein